MAGLNQRPPWLSHRWPTANSSAWERWLRAIWFAELWVKCLVSHIAQNVCELHLQIPMMLINMVGLLLGVQLEAGEADQVSLDAFHDVGGEWHGALILMELEDVVQHQVLSDRVHTQQDLALVPHVDEGWHDVGNQ